MPVFSWRYPHANRKGLGNVLEGYPSIDDPGGKGTSTQGSDADPSDFPPALAMRVPLRGLPVLLARHTRCRQGGPTEPGALPGEATNSIRHCRLRRHSMVFPHASGRIALALSLSRPEEIENFSPVW